MLKKIGQSIDFTLRVRRRAKEMGRISHCFAEAIQKFSRRHLVILCHNLLLRGIYKRVQELDHKILAI